MLYGSYALARRAGWAALALLVVLTSPRLEASEPSARDLFQQGNRALAARRRHEALTLFLRSLALVRRPSTLLNIAQCYRLLHFPERALTFYQRYLEAYGQTSSPIPFHAEVREHVGRLRVQRELLKKARIDQREGAHRAAIKRLSLARELTRWPGVSLLLAQSYQALGERALARAAAAAALTAYESHVERWRDSDGAPRHVQAGLEAARRLLRGLRAGRHAARDPAPTKKRSKAWLITAIVAGGLAVAAEIVAWVFFAKANRLQTDDPTFDRYKSVVIGGHISAGLFGLLSATGVVLHVTLAPSDTDRSAPRGALLQATFRF